jgi:ATP-dependent DNA ligase
MITDTWPDRKHLVHKPVELRNLSKKLQESVDIHSDEYVWQYKYDGCHMIVVVHEGKAQGFSRTGEVVLSCDHILREIEGVCESAGVTNYVFFGEAWDRLQTHSKISGDFRRHSASELGYRLFDGVPLADFATGHCPITYTTRFTELLNILYRSDHGELMYVSYAESFEPSKLSEQQQRIAVIRRNGTPYELDGFVAKRKDGLWTAGAGKGGEAIKVKNHVSLDLRCVGLEMGLGKFAGMVGSLTCEYKGGLITVGGGTLTDEQRGFYWRYKHLIVGYIVEVHALAASEHGDLREARFHRMRDDKTEPSE